MIDRFICDEISRGADTIINLAAGLDARPYRLQIPPELRWVEVDLEDLIAQKEELLKNEKPACQLKRYRLNLMDRAARQVLFQELSGKARRAVIVTEGLVMYLSPGEVQSLAIDLAAPKAFRSWILDLYHPRLLAANGRGKMGRTLAQANAQFRFAPAEGPAFFDSFGWSCVHAESTLKAAVRHGRGPLLVRLLLPLFERHSTRRAYAWSGVALLEAE